MQKNTNKNEVVFIFLLSAWMLWSCFKGFGQPLYWDSAYSLQSHAKRIATNFNIFNYQQHSNREPTPILTSLVSQESDYPHTFGLAMIYAFFIGLFPNHYVWILHGLSFLFSLAFISTVYVIFKNKIGRMSAGVVAMLIATNSIFLAQTTLVYHEIPALLFRYLAIYYLINDKKNWFIFNSIVAFIIRFENGPILIGSAIFWFAIIKNWSFSTKGLKKSGTYVLPLVTVVIFWFFVHYQLNNWLLISPLFGHPIERGEATLELLSFLFLEQGRWIISILTAIFFPLSWVRFEQHKKIISLLVVATTPVFFIVWNLGNGLPRYVLPVLPVYYSLFAIAFFPKKPKLSIKSILALIATIFIVLYQISFHYKCESNFETCFNFTKIIELKKEVATFLEKNTSAESTIYANWDEIAELSEPKHSFGYFCKECSQAKFKLFPNTVDEYLEGDYILITPNSENRLIEIEAAKKIELIRLFKKDEMQAKLLRVQKK